MTEVILHDHVTPFMELVSEQYFIYVKEWDDVFPIVFGDEEVTMNEGEKDQYTERMQDVSFDAGDSVYTITNEYCFHSMDEALEVAKQLREARGYDTMIYAFRHGDSDWARALTIEPEVMVNRLGYGVFVNMDKAMRPVFNLTLPQMRFIVTHFPMYWHEHMNTDIFVKMQGDDLIINEKTTDFYNHPTEFNVVTHDYYVIRTVTPQGTCTTTTEGRVFTPPEGFVPSFPHRHASSVIGHTNGGSPAGDPPNPQGGK